VSFEHLIPLVIKLSVILTVFALGMNASLRDATYLFRKPTLLIRSLVSMNIVMLIVAIAIVRIFDLPPAVKIALVALAVSPVPPALPKKAVKVPGEGSYGIGLLVAAALSAIILVPISVEILGKYFGTDSHMPVDRVALVVVTVVLAPLLAGIGVRHLAPALSVRVARGLSLIAAVALTIAILPVLFTTSHAIWQMIGSGLLDSLIAFAVIGLAVGHWLGGPNADDRTVLALASSMRHPGVALAIASLNFPNEKAVLAVMLCHLVIGTLVAIPYMYWRKSALARNGPDTRS